MKTLGNQIKIARQQRHFSQSFLARKVGCRQSALSMYESGRSTALSAQVIGKLCEELGLIPPTQTELAVIKPTFSTTRSFCPNPDCLGNLPIMIGNRTVLVPHAHLTNEDECHCAWCGEVLEKICPECGVSINSGAFCSHCGIAYLADTPIKVDPIRIATSERFMAWIH